MIVDFSVKHIILCYVCAFSLNCYEANSYGLKKNETQDEKGFEKSNQLYDIESN